MLSGGEIAAMAVIDAVARHLAGALGARDSAEHESFSPALEGRIEHPHYTRPPTFRGWEVPEVLLSGDHGAVDRWRREHESERRTRSGSVIPRRSATDGACWPPLPDREVESSMSTHHPRHRGQQLREVPEFKAGDTVRSTSA